MDIHSRHFGSIATSVTDQLSVDVGALIRRLLLFEHVTVESHRLQEIPHLVATFGHKGVRRLLESPDVDLVQDARTQAQVGQFGVAGKRPLPLGSYQIATVELLEWTEDVRRCTSVVDECEHLSNKNRNRLKMLLEQKTMRFPKAASRGALDAFDTELATEDPWLVQTLHECIGRSLTGDPDYKMEVNIERLDSQTCRVATNLGARGIPLQSEHNAVGSALLGIANLNYRIALMAELQSLTGFREDELPVFASKLRFLADALDPTEQERRFDRVVEIRDLPSLHDLEPGVRVDIDQLLDIRDSAECRDFRTWLRGLNEESEADIADRFRSLHERVSSLTHSRVGRTVRLLIQSGAGLVPAAAGLPPDLGIASGLVASTLDGFVVDNLVGRPGPVSFIGHKYRSIFDT